jgi:sulfatase modifying factor 1
VGEKRANGFGLFDVLGNVEEWVNDWYDENYYKHSPSQDPAGPPSNPNCRALRGGSYSALSRDVRVSYRGGPDRNIPGVLFFGTMNGGIRCVGEVFAP